MRKRCIIPNIIFFVVCILFILPLFMIFSLSFTKEVDIATYGYRIIPKEITLEAYKFIMQSPEQILTSYKNSIIITTAGSVVSLFFTSGMGYVMSRRDYVLSKYIVRYALFAMLFHAGLVPTYIVISQFLKLSNTLWVMILPMLIAPWNLFLMRSFMQTIPMEIIEAASVDGSSELSTFFRVILPLSKPGLATVGLLTVFGYWNDWWYGMMYVDNMNFVPLQSLLYRIISNIQFLAQGGVGTVTISSAGIPTLSARMATCVIAIVPMMIIFPFFQKYLVKGLMLGSVKG